MNENSSIHLNDNLYPPLLTKVLTPNASLSELMRDKTIDWEQLFRVARNHRVDSILYKLLESSDCLPAGVLKRELNNLSRIDDFRKMEKIEVHANLSSLLTQHEMKFISLKGPVLSQILFNDPLWRNYGDLDILVQEAQSNDVIRLLERAGFSKVKGNEQFHISMLSPNRRVVTEIHFAIAPPRFSQLHNNALLWENTTSVTVYNNDFLSLDNETTLVYLCHHGSRHRWERLQWAVDVAMLVENVALNWARVETIARKTSQTRALAAGIFVCQLWFDIKIPYQFTESSRKHSKLVNVTNRMIQVKDKSPYEATLWRFRIEIFFLEKVNDQIGYVIKFVSSRLFTLNYKDKPFPVPFYLAWIYYLVRFMRLSIHVFGPGNNKGG